MSTHAPQPSGSSHEAQTPHPAALVCATRQNPQAPERSGHEQSAQEPPQPQGHAVVLLHGYMSNEQDLLGLAPMLPPDAHLFSLRAPLQLAPGGFAWFPLSMDPSGEIGHAPHEAQAAAEQVIGWMEEHLRGFQHVTLLGFSQGMALATLIAQLAPARSALPRIDAVVGLSGFWLEPEQAVASSGDAPPSFFWGRGLADPVISAARVERTEQALAQWASRTGAAVVAKRYPRLPHSVSEAEMEDVRAFLQTVLGPER